MANITLRLLRRCRQPEVVNILLPNRTRLISTTPCLKPKDDVTAANKSPAPTLVYAGTLDKQVYRIKLFSLASSAVIMSSQPLLWTKLTALNSVIMQSAIGGCLSFFFLGTPLLIHLFTRKYVIDLTLDQDKKIFEASTYSFLLRRKKLQFTQADIQIPPIPLPFTTLYAKGKPLLFTPDEWKSRFAYDHLMLLDKGVDWSKIQTHGRKDG